MKKRNKSKNGESFSVDGLTGLLSRKGFEEAAAEVLRKAADQNYVIVEFDLVNFKRVNRTYGHDQGDQLLKGVAEALKEWKNNDIVCCRINADDFLILSEGRESLLSELEMWLRETIRNQKELAVFGAVSFTFGAYEIKDNKEIVKTIIDKANMAHKAARQSGNRQVVWYDEELIEKLETEKRYIARMEKGLSADEFKMYLQMKIDLSSMKITGAEALVRWEIPGKGLVFPDSFIPLFEKSGGIVDLDYYMLEKACEYLRGWLDQGKPDLTISVNFSRVTMYHEKFYETVLEIVDRYQLPHSSIEIEVTESAFNEVTDAALQTLRRLMDEGFLVSMDDFGAGYSNLNMLGRLPIHIIKLDRAFMLEMNQNRHTRGLVACVVDMSHAMGLQVVCEGVEREEHLRLLKDMSCDFAQGYFFSKPVPQMEFEQLYQSFQRPEVLPEAFKPSPEFKPIDRMPFDIGDDKLEESLLATYPGFLSLRNEKHEIVYLNENFRSWIAQFTDVDPLGKTNVELATMVPKNVADTFLQCNDGSMELQKDAENRTGLKKVIEFHDGTEEGAHTQYLDVLKYWVKLNDKPYIFTIAYDITGIYVENLRNLQSSMTDSLTGARNRRYMQAELDRYQGNYAAILNLDLFRRINRQEGYMTGDRILKEFVTFIRENVKDAASIIRLGGAEFLVVFQKGLEQEQIVAALKEVRALYEKAYAPYDYLTFSMGVDVISSRLDDTLRRLDLLMEEDKERNMNQ